MSTNYTPFSDADRRSTSVLMATDLTVGQRLIRRKTTPWGGSVTYVPYTVVKVLASRLVIRPADATDDKRDIRVLVTNSKSWPTRNGRVETGYQGQGEWSRDGVYLFTEDDAYLARLSAADKVTMEKQSIEDAVDRALNTLERNGNRARNFQAADIDAAINALQNLLAIKNKEN